MREYSMSVIFFKVFYQRMKSAEVVTDRFRSREKVHQRRKSPQNDHGSPRRKISGRQVSKKRVCFNDDIEVKIFRKSDEPSHKGLSIEELNQYQNQFYSLMGCDSGLADSSTFLVDVKAAKRKQAAEEELRLQEKLENMEAEIPFYNPLPLRVTCICEHQSSIQKIQHQKRISGLFDFLYSPLSDIPDQPTFELINTSNSTPQSVPFESAPPAKWEVVGEKKPLKGILKDKGVPLQPSIQLIELIKKMTRNPKDFPKSQVEALLQPFKDNGQLASLRANKQLYNSLTISPSPSPSPPRNIPQPAPNVINQPYINHIKYDNFHQPYHQPHYYIPQPTGYQPHMPAYYERPFPNYYQPNPYGVYYPTHQ